MDTANSQEQAAQAVQSIAEHLLSVLNPMPLTVGLSGGADSTLALIVAVTLRKLDPRFAVRAVHCIHGLDESDPQWLEHCRKLCGKLGVELVTPRLDIRLGGGVSPEESSRNERYRALLENKLEPGYLVLGHQQDDQVENFLLALKRGSGPKGLSGMRELIEDGRGAILRPLLGLSKSEIEGILGALGYTYTNDESNEYLSFERNYMRLKVLPVLRSRFEGFDTAVLRSQMLCGAEHELAERYVAEAVPRYIDGLTLDFSQLDLSDYSFCIMLLRHFLSGLGEQPPDFSLIRSLYELMQGSSDTSAVFTFAGCSIRRYKKTIIASAEYTYPDKGRLYPLEPGRELVLGDFGYELIACDPGDRGHGFYAEGGSTLYLNFSYLGSAKLKPRLRSMRREIKKLFGEYNVPPFMRPSVPLVQDGEGRVLALGSIFAADEGFASKEGEYLRLVTRVLREAGQARG